MVPSVLCAILALIAASPATLANLLDPLRPEDGAAEELSKKFQPAMDFDMDSCYHVVALDLHSNFNEGQLPFNPKGNFHCRTEDRLMHSNAYVRRRCNHFWCAYLYGYYFEKDEGTFNAHMHDWEHVIVWTLHDEVFYVSWSAHGEYTTKHIDDSDLHFHERTHVKIVNHLGGSGTHSLRLATDEDEPPENHWGQWFVAWLVEVTWMEPWSDMLVHHDWGHAHPDIGDRFGEMLEKYAPWDATHNEGFDPWSDEDTFAMRSAAVASGRRINGTAEGNLIKQDL